MIKVISQWSLPKGGDQPVAESLAIAKAQGFAGLELTIALEGPVNVKTTRKQCEGYRKEIEKSGVIVETLASGMSWGLNPISEQAKVREQSIKAHSAALERAAWLGCKAMLFVPGVVGCPFVPDRVRYDHALERAREAIKRLLDTAEKVGVDLCLENVWNGFLYSPVEFAQFVDSFKSKRLGVYFDVGNGIGYHQHPPHWIELLGKRIKRVHIKDFKENFGWLGAYSFCGLMEGQVPWPETMKALREIGYDSTLVAEMMPYDPAVLDRTSAAMDRILAL